MKNLVKTIQNTAFQNELWAKGSRIVLGVSGGPDSVCMLDVMAKIAPKYDLELIIAHVNYGLRGKDSDKDEKFVRELAEKYGLPIYTLTPPHPPFGHLLPKREKEKMMPSENNLRNIRYEFFEKIRKENKFDLIAVAHNADDQVETFLMRIIRGSGLQGLAAMKYKSGNLIRPLLGISREEILNYLKKNKLKFRTDKTNTENLFLRNKIRNKLIPFLEKNFNPSIKKTILNSVTGIVEDYALIQELADRISKAKSLSVKKLLALHPAFQRRVILSHVEQVKGDTKNIEAKHIEEILKIAKSAKGKNQKMFVQGLKIMRKGDRMDIRLNS